MPRIAVEEAIEAIREGKMVILVDDEDRENEGDLTMAAEKVTPEAINFMAKYGRGLICLSMTGEMCDRLKAAVDARTDSDFVIMARTDAFAREGLAAAIDRAGVLVSGNPPQRETRFR